jgi:hypothetical protein
MDACEANGRMAGVNSAYMLSLSPSPHLIVVDVDVAVSCQRQKLFLDVLERGM